MSIKAYSVIPGPTPYSPVGMALPAETRLIASLVISGAAGAGGQQRTAMPSTIPQVRALGSRISAYKDDLYERIHYSFVRFAFGNIVGRQELQLRVWNAYTRAEFFSGLTVLNGDGVTLVGQPTPPVFFRPLQEAVYNLVVTPDGPPGLDATLVFQWAGSTTSIQLTGNRITAWTTPPDWSNPVNERFEWATDVIRSYNGKEQRRSLRRLPRAVYEFDVTTVKGQRQITESNTWGWGARTWALPLWPEGLTPTAPLAQGDTSIAFPTTGRRYRAGGLGLILSPSGEAETLEIDNVTAQAITIKRPLIRTWPANSVVYPVVVARLNDSVSFERFTGDASMGRMSFEVDEAPETTAEAGPTLYRGKPVLTRPPNWTGGLSWELRRKLAEIDNITGVRNVQDESGVPFVTQRMLHTLTDKTGIDQMRALLFLLRGRQGSVWVPTWTQDMTLRRDIVGAELGIEIESINQALQVGVSTGRRDLRIELIDGRVFYRRILGSATGTDGSELIAIDSAIGENVPRNRVVAISFMALCRLSSDAAQFSYWSGDVADIGTTWQGFQHDL
jgi:hypothetical protein